MEITGVLIIQIIIVILSKVAALTLTSSLTWAALTIGESEVVTKSSGLLQSLAEHLVFLDIIV